MPDTIIADTSCFIILNNIGELLLLQKLYEQVVTTIEVSNEYGESLPEWIEIRRVGNNFRQILELQVDKAKASTLALALETENCTIILDDYRARKIAEKLKLNYTGTIGVIVKAKSKGIIPSVKPILDKILLTNFRLSDEIENQALQAAGESK